MRFESHALEVLMDESWVAFEGAIDDSLAEARRRAPHVTGKYRDSIQATPIVVTDRGFEARIGSPLSSARVKEVGGFIQAKASRAAGRFAGYMRIPFAGGGWATVEAFRIRATPTIVPAGRKFPAFMTARLREAHSPLTGRGRRSVPVRPDMRSGPVELPR